MRDRRRSLEVALALTPRSVVAKDLKHCVAIGQPAWDTALVGTKRRREEHEHAEFIGGVRFWNGLRATMPFARLRVTRNRVEILGPGRGRWLSLDRDDVSGVWIDRHSTGSGLVFVDTDGRRVGTSFIGASTDVLARLSELDWPVLPPPPERADQDEGTD